MNLLLVKTLLLLVFLLFGSWANSDNTEESRLKCKYYYDSNLKKKIYTQADEMPRFPTNVEGMVSFMMKNMKKVDQEEIQESIRLAFVIDVDGQVINEKINGKKIEDYTAWEKEMLRVLRIIPKWVPATCKKKTVAFQWYQLVHIRTY